MTEDTSDGRRYRGTRLSPLFTWRGALVESELPATSKHVGLTLSLHMSERGDSAFPSLRTLQAETSRGRTTVSEALTHLVDKGYLEIARAGGGRGLPTVYRAVFPPTKQSGDETLSEGASEAETVRFRAENGTASGPEDVKRAPGRETDASASALSRPPNLPFDALAEETDADVESRGSEIAGALARIRKLERRPAQLDDEWLAAEIRLRAQLYRDRMDGALLTPTALAKWWRDLPKLESLRRGRRLSGHDLIDAGRTADEEGMW